MRIVEAHWEKRNLGVTCFEISIESGDSMEDFLAAERKIIEEQGGEYLVVKAPIGHTEFLHGLSSAGYVFLESAFRLALKKSQYSCPSLIERLDKDATVEFLTTADEMEPVFNEIRKGIFNTDRVSIDGHFSEEVTSGRYINWIGDVMTAGGVMCQVTVGDGPIGFFVLQPIDSKRVRGILTGLYEDFGQSGMGGLLMKKVNDHIWDAGYSIFEAHVASNNLAAVRSNMIFGAQIEEISYTYSKMIEKT